MGWGACDYGFAVRRTGLISVLKKKVLVVMVSPVDGLGRYRGPRLKTQLRYARPIPVLSDVQDLSY